MRRSRRIYSFADASTCVEDSVFSEDDSIASSMPSLETVPEIGKLEAVERGS